MEEDEKTLIYKIDYQPNDFYWGFGIEREFYLELDKTEEVTLYDLMENTQRERYSVDYNYNFSAKKRKFISDLEKNSKLIKINIPLYWTSHALEKTDRYKEHKTIYGYLKKLNCNFYGKTILEELTFRNSFFEKEKGNGKTFIFDGDTFEIATRNFYKKTIDKVFQEYQDKKNLFINELQNTWKLLDEYKLYGNPKMAEWNYGWVRFWTNSKQISICNNGTFHLNLTLPSKLNDKNQLINEDEFLDKHLWCIRYLQWFEPLLISFLGSPDIFSIISTEEETQGFAHGSLRIGLSRYIGMGTYDIRKREIGKILTVEKRDIQFTENDFWWLKRIEKDQAYIQPSTIGYDFNVKKHHHSGFEWRIFDSFPDEFLLPLSRFLCLICDYALESRNSIVNENAEIIYSAKYLSKNLQNKLKLNPNLEKELFEFNHNKSQLNSISIESFNENNQIQNQEFLLNQSNILLNENNPSINQFTEFHPELNQNQQIPIELNQLNQLNQYNKLYMESNCKSEFINNNIIMDDNKINYGKSLKNESPGLLSKLFKKIFNENDNDNNNINQNNKLNEKKWMIPPIAGLTPLWNDLAYQSIIGGNKCTFLTYKQILELNEILNIPFANEMENEIKLNYQNLNGKFSYGLDNLKTNTNVIDDNFIVMSPIEYINEYSKKVYSYFIKKGKFGPCYENFMEKENRLQPHFSLDYNNFLWSYQWIYYTESLPLNYESYIEHLVEKTITEKLIPSEKLYNKNNLNKKISKLNEKDNNNDNEFQKWILQNIYCKLKQSFKLNQYIKLYKSLIQQFYKKKILKPSNINSNENIKLNENENILNESDEMKINLFPIDKNELDANIEFKKAFESLFINKIKTESIESNSSEESFDLGHSLKPCFIEYNLEKDKHKIRFIELCEQLGIIKIKYLTINKNINIKLKWISYKTSFWDIFIPLHYLSHYQSKSFYKLSFQKFNHFESFNNFLKQEVSDNQYSILKKIIYHLKLIDPIY